MHCGISWNRNDETCESYRWYNLVNLRLILIFLSQCDTYHLQIQHTIAIQALWKGTHLNNLDQYKMSRVYCIHLVSTNKFVDILVKWMRTIVLLWVQMHIKIANWSQNPHFYTIQRLQHHHSMKSLRWKRIRQKPKRAHNQSNGNGIDSFELSWSLCWCDFWQYTDVPIKT